MDTDFGVIDFDIAQSEFKKVKKNLKPTYIKWSDKNQHGIGKYAPGDCKAATVWKFKLHFQKLNKALCVSLKKCYNNLKDTKEKQSEPSKSFSKYQSKTGR